MRRVITRPTWAALQKVKKGIDLVEPDQAMYYGGDEKGYTHYPRAEV